MRDTIHELETWLAAGGKRIGQIAISPVPDGWELRHVDDAGRTDLATWVRWQDARSLANLDDAGAYRALKTAPTLRHGWRLVLGSADEVRRALDYFYPAMLGVWLAWKAGEVQPVCLRETLARQTGMYRITQKLTDEQAQALIGKTCANESCRKTVLWSIAPGQRIETLPAEKFVPGDGTVEWPLPCQEACNFLVAGARKVIKGEA